MLTLAVVTLTSMGYSQTVTIGTQVWMTKNLDVATFRNGDIIPEAKTAEEWKLKNDAGEPAWCYYLYRPVHRTTFGKLYNWHAVNDPRGLAPTGYHVPSDAEWKKLTDYLGGAEKAGKKMKNASGWSDYRQGFWSSTKTCPNCASWNAEYRRKVACHTCQDTRVVTVPEVTISGNGTNSCGFSGLPGGRAGSGPGNSYTAIYGYYDGTFIGIREYGNWWSSSESTISTAIYHSLNYDDDSVDRGHAVKGTGFSVRCLRN